MESIKYLSVLNDPKENRLMLQKLPVQIAERWNRIVTKNISDAEGEFPSFDEFTKFVKDEAKIACNPTFSYSAINKKKEQVTIYKEKQLQSKIAKHSSFVTKSDRVTNNIVSTTSG